MELDFSTKLGNAFKAMREQGLLARQNFSCCGGCAGYSLVRMAVKKKQKGVEVKGCAFYHAQDNQNKRDGDNFYIGYGPLDTTEFGTIGLTDVEVGKIVVECLTAAGVETEWVLC